MFDRKWFIFLGQGINIGLALWSKIRDVLVEKARSHEQVWVPWPIFSFRRQNGGPFSTFGLFATMVSVYSHPLKGVHRREHIFVKSSTTLLSSKKD